MTNRSRCFGYCAGSLLRSPFFFTPGGKSVSDKESFTEKFRYEGGYFGKLAVAGQLEWKEWKTESGEFFYFQELNRESEMIWLKDASRNLLIRLPAKGGASKISADGGRTWQKLYNLQRD